MCAGDLGMYRVMPWSYPPISGGSSGGFSPDDSGGGSGSGGNNFLVKTDETVLQFLYGGQVYTSSTLKLTIQIENGKFGFGDLRGIDSVRMYGTVKEVILEDSGSDVTNLLKEDVKYSSVSLTNLQNSVRNQAFNYTFNVNPLPGSSGDITPKKVVFGIKYEAYNADGAVVDTVTFPDMVFES